MCYPSNVVSKGQIGSLSWNHDGVFWGLSRLSWGRIAEARVLRELRWKPGAADQSPPYVAHVVVLRTHPNGELVEHLSEVADPELWDALIAELRRRQIPTELNWTEGAPMVTWTSRSLVEARKALGPYREVLDDVSVLDARVILPGPQVGSSLGRIVDSKASKVTLSMGILACVTTTSIVGGVYAVIAAAASVPLGLMMASHSVLAQRRALRRGKPRMARLRLRRHELECSFFRDHKHEECEKTMWKIDARSYDGITPVAGGHVAFWFGRNAWLLINDSDTIAELVERLRDIREAHAQ